MPFHLKKFPCFLCSLDVREIYLHAITSNISGGFEIFLTPQPPLIYQFLLYFLVEVYFQPPLTERGWGGEKYYKQLFDNDAYETTLSAFYTFKLIDTQQQLNTFLNPSI